MAETKKINTDKFESGPMFFRDTLGSAADN